MQVGSIGCYIADVTQLRQVEPGDPTVREFLERRGMAVAVRNGQLFDALSHPAVVAEDTGAVGLRFYQRRGFRLARIRPGAVDEARRTLKPEIASTGNYGIPIRDEIELEQPLPWR